MVDTIGSALFAVVYLVWRILSWLWRDFLAKPTPIWLTLLLAWAALRTFLRIAGGTDKWTAEASSVLQEHAARLTALDKKDLGELTDLAYRASQLEARADSEHPRDLQIDEDRSAD
jgi:hypothetical protein